MAVEPASRFKLPIAVVEEGLRGWLAAVAKERDVFRQVIAYRDLGLFIQAVRAYDVVPFDDIAAAHFKRFRAAKSTVKTMDLKIACIALANDALLLTANRQDFEKDPGLRFENWMDPPPTL